MSHANSATSSSPDFQLIFNNALKAYRKRTRKDLLAHPLFAKLQNCNSSSDVLTLINQHIQGLHQSQRHDERLTRWLDPTVRILCAFSESLGEGVSLAFSPAKAIFAGAGVLLSAAMDVHANQDNLIYVFEHMENFFQPPEIYTRVTLPIIVKIMVEVLSILGISMKEMKQGRIKKYLKKLIGKTDIEDALKRLDNLKNEVVRMADMVRNDEGNETRVVIQQVADDVDQVKQSQLLQMTDVVGNDGKERRKDWVVIPQVADNMDPVKRNQLRLDLFKWLSPPDPSINHNITCGAYHKKTSEWFFRGSIFTEWKFNASLLWLHGKPGSGKSVLCSTIIQEITALRDNGLASMAYFYFDFRDPNKQGCRDLLPSIVTQLSFQSHRHCDMLNNLYLKHESGARKPSGDELIQCLKDMLALPNQQPVYIIIDALDESPTAPGFPSPREMVVDLVEELVKSSSQYLHLCVTSRPEIDIRDALEPLASFQVSLHEQSGQRKDIFDYVTSVVHSDPKMRRWREEDKELVIETLSVRANGMFRWVFCQLEALRHCLAPRVRHMLRQLPETLDETYERMLRDINEADWKHVYCLLQCLTVAVRPLRVAELAEALATDFGIATCEGTSRLNTDWRWEDHQEVVFTACSSLISIVNDDDASQVVQFSHFSVKEFLTSPRIAVASAGISRFQILPELAHTTLAKACLGALLRLGEQQNVDDKFPLAQYAAKHWVQHARFENVSSYIGEGMVLLFDPDKPYFASWLQVHDIDIKPPLDSPLGYFAVCSHEKSNNVTPLYYAALCGFHDLAEQLIIEHPQQVDLTCGYYVSPLAAALSGGHLMVAQLLHGRGANVDVQGHDNCTALDGASCSGRLEIVEWLLSRSANPHVRNKLFRWTPLHSAACFGHVGVCRSLLQYGADNNAKDGDGKTPLHLASEAGHVYVAQLLLEHGTDVNARDNYHDTPLHRASMEGRLDVAFLLVNSGAEIDSKDMWGRTAFQVASEGGKLDMAKFLSDNSPKRLIIPYHR